MKTLRNNGAATAARRRPLAALFEVAGRRQTYRNGMYLLTSFPLGLTYFFLVVPGLAVSIGTAMFVGVPLLLLLCSIWWRLGAFERLIARRWLGVDIAPPPRPQVERVLSLARLISPTMWKIVGYLLLKLPFGVMAYALGASLLFICFGLLIPSCTYLVGSALGLAVGGRMQPDEIVQAIVMAAAGLVLLPLSLHALNALAAAWGRVARYLLGVNPLAVQLSAAVATAELAQEKAARAEQSRRELIVNVSHELRTPIANIRGHVESLLMATGDGAAGVPVPEQRVYLNIVHREAERLSALVDDLLALARADAGELRLEIAPVSVGEVIEEVYQSMAPLAKRERQVTVIRDVCPGLPPALADRRRLAQVVLNLVRNAVTYTPTGGIVSLSLCAADATHLALTVADTGIGIPPDELEHIFERFYRADASRARATGGFGLGLAIVRDLVGAMGGSITVESAVDKGSSFRILLPVAATAPPDEMGEHRRMATILVIEDDVDLNNLVRSHLEDDGHLVHQAFDGATGLALVEEHAPHLVLLDWMLPGIDGLAVCRQIRQKHLMPIVMLTARGEEIDRVLGLEVGADDYIVKPFSVREVLARVRAILRRVELDSRALAGAVESGRPAADAGTIGSSPEGSQSDGTVTHGPLCVNPTNRAATLHGVELELTPKEFDLLALLATHPGRAFSRDFLLEHLWGYDYDGFDRTVDTHIQRLRKKLGPMGEKIGTVWGVGYRFTE